MFTADALLEAISPVRRMRPRVDLLCPNGCIAITIPTAVFPQAFKLLVGMQSMVSAGGGGGDGKSADDVSGSGWCHHTYCCQTK